MPSFRHLSAFTVIADVESLSKAATLLGVVPSALSAQVVALEREFGCKLLRRDGRGVHLTEAGLELLYRARRIVGSMRNLETQIRGPDRAVDGELTFGVLPSLAGRLIPTLHLAVRARYPEVRLVFIEGLSGDLAEQIEAGEIDIATLYKHQVRPDQLSATVFVEDLLLTGAADELASDGTIALAAALDRPLVVPTRRHGLRFILEAAAREIGASLRVDAEIDSLGAVEALVRRGRAFSILPRGIADRLAQGSKPKLAAVRVSELNRRVELARSRGLRSAAGSEVFKLVLELPAARP